MLKDIGVRCEQNFLCCYLSAKSTCEIRFFQKDQKMISLLSSSTTKFLLKKSVIQDEEKELYDYGLFMLISYVAFFMLSVLFGLI